MNADLKFGTSGLRGLATRLDRATCSAYTRAFIGMLKQSGFTLTALCIGMDLRPSSAQMAAWCAEAAIDEGLAIINGGTIPTPALARYALGRSLPALMITASHNPVEHNGIKFYRPDGELMKEDEAPMTALLARDAGVAADRVPDLPPVALSVASEYINSYRTLFAADALARMRLGVDQHSAVGRDILVTILESLGAECFAVRRSDSFIAIDTEALPSNYLDLARGWLGTGRFDAIVSTDGDGDRPLLIDETGRQVQGDVLGILAAHHLGYDAIATPVSSTSAVEDSLWFQSVRRTRIGSPYVIAAMRDALEAGAVSVAGFEGNGGMLTGGIHRWRDRSVHELMTRDAVLPMLATLSMARESGLAVSALTRLLPRRSKATGRLADVDTDKARLWIEGLVSSAAIREAALPVLSQTERIETVDGAKFLLRDGSSLHFRLSGNAPELRCYVESVDPDTSHLALEAALDTARAAVT
ncbi:MAG TPA: phosphomannomutase [Devosia sp.]|nr:phosphomannomutase [Devosia sp.]